MPSHLAASAVLSKKEALIAQINSPAHLAAKQLTLDREKRIAARIDARLEELRQLLTETQLPEELKIRAMIEEKQLKLLVTQKRLRHRIAAELRYEMQLACAEDPTLFRRSSKKHTKQTVSRSERQKEREEQVRKALLLLFPVSILTYSSPLRSANNTDKKSFVQLLLRMPKPSATFTGACSRNGRRFRERW